MYHLIINVTIHDYMLFETELYRISCVDSWTKHNRDIKLVF